MATRQPVSERLRAALKKCSESRYALSKRTGISQSALSRFLSGEFNLTLANAELLAEALGFEIRLCEGDER